MPIATSHTFTRLLEETENTPIEVVEECQSNYKRAERAHNQKIYETLALVAAIVLKLRASPKDRTAFHQHEFWAGARLADDDAKLPRRVMRFVVGAQTAKGALYEQARAHANVVGHLLDEGLSPPEILQRLTESSVHKLTLLIAKQARQTGRGASEAAATTPAQRSVEKARASGDEVIGGTAPEDKDEEQRTAADKEAPEGERDQTATPPRNQSAHRVPAEPGLSGGGNSGETPDRRPTLKSDRDVWFDAAGHFDTILNIEEGDEVTVTLRCEGSDKAWVKLRAINAQRVLRTRPRLH